MSPRREFWHCLLLLASIAAWFYALVAMPCGAQTQAYPDGYQTNINLNQANSGLGLATTAPLTLYVDGVAGSDSNPCTGPTTACKTIPAACALIPKRVRHPVTVYVDAGTFATGCYLENFGFEPGFSPADGGYIDIEGTLIDATLSQGNVSGTLSAPGTQLSNNTFGTITDGTSNWAANALRGSWLEITAGTGVGDVMAIYGNTATVITVAGKFHVTPANGDTYHIRTQGTIINGGLAMPPTAPAKINVTTSGKADAVANAAAFILSGNRGGTAAPEIVSPSASSSQNASGSIILSKMASTTFAGEFASARTTDYLMVRYSSGTGQNPANIAWITSDGHFIIAIGNYINGSSNGGALNLAKHAGRTLSTFVFSGNVGDSAAEITDDTGGVSPVSIVSQANSYQNGNIAYISVGAAVIADLTDDKVETVTGDYCADIGNGLQYHNGTQWSGVGSYGKIAGGLYNTCGFGGLFLSGSWSIQGGAGNQITGTATAGFGITAARSSQIIINAVSGSALTGPSGDTTLDGTNAVSYTNLGTYGQFSNAGLANSILSGAGSASGGTNFTSLGGAAGLIQVANASLPSCGALYTGSLYWDTTNVCVTRCNGTTWQCLDTSATGGSEWSLAISDPVTAVVNTNDFWAFGPTQNATTMRNCTCAVPILGGGTGTETWKITGAANGGGTVYATVVIPCNAAAGANCTSCTINTSAIPAATTLHAAVTSACTTADVTSNVAVDLTTP